MRRFMDQTAVYGNNNCGSEQPFEAFHTSNDGSNNTNDHHDASGRGDDISPVEQFPFSPNMMSALMNGAGVMGMSPGARLKPRRQSYV